MRCHSSNGSSEAHRDPMSCHSYHRSSRSRPKPCPHRDPDQLLPVVAGVLPYDGAARVGEDLVADILHPGRRRGCQLAQKYSGVVAEVVCEPDLQTSGRRWNRWRVRSGQRSGQVRGQMRSSRPPAAAGGGGVRGQVRSGVGGQGSSSPLEQAASEAR